MATYHVGCGIAGIYAGTLKKNGYEWINKSDVTDEAINAVFQHIVLMEKFDTEGFAGYVIPKKKSDGEVCLCVFDADKYELKEKTK